LIKQQKEKGREEKSKKEFLIKQSETQRELEKQLIENKQKSNTRDSLSKQN
jgi:hypothetical protein